MTTQCIIVTTMIAFFLMRIPESDGMDDMSSNQFSNLKRSAIKASRSTSSKTALILVFVFFANSLALSIATNKEHHSNSILEQIESAVDSLASLEIPFVD